MTDKIIATMVRGAHLLVDNGLNEWKIRINNATATIAETTHSKKMITISQRFLRIATKEQFDGVFLHELAHAKLGEGFGHGQDFINTCLGLGVDPYYARPGVDIRIRRFIVTCPGCGQEGDRNKPILAHCGRCLNKLENKPNPLTLAEW